MRLHYRIFVLLMLACTIASAQHITQRNYQRKIPAGVNMQKISDSIYYDKNDITNQDWGEYQFWLRKIYGEESAEYHAAMPDTNIVKQQISFTTAKSYVASPMYRHYPALGVNVQQARAYCQWRTDRVAEYMLVKMKLLEYDSNQMSTSFFTLEKYDSPYSLKILIFSLPTEEMETRYGFRCVARWR